MAYSFRTSDQSVETGLRRIAASQLEAGLDELRDDTLPRAEKVHAARKRCKKLRGLIRLVRPSFDGYSDENRVFRDAARSLSDVRDATASLEQVDELEDYFDAELKKAALKPLREALEKRRAAIDDDEVEEKLADMRLVFREALDRSETWSLEETGADAFMGGAAKTYGRARKAMKTARKSGDPADMHEWRKRVKYHWYHARLVKRLWPPVLGAYVDEADALSDDLGEHHDLHVLGERAKAVLGETSETAELLVGLAAARQAQLEEACFLRGEKLFAEKPDTLARRWGEWWEREINSAAAG